jgi:hypothetical protein
MSPMSGHSPHTMAQKPWEAKKQNQCGCMASLLPVPEKGRHHSASQAMISHYRQLLSWAGNQLASFATILSLPGVAIREVPA